MSKAVKVAVLGAGVIGLFTAYELLQAGAEVVVVGRQDGEAPASLRSFSWLNAFGRYPAAYHALRLRGLSRYREMAGEQAVSWLRFDGSLTWRDPARVQRLEAVMTHLRSLGYPAVWLDHDDAARKEPALSPAAYADSRIVFAPEEGWVDLPPLLAWLRDRIAQSGGTMLRTRGAASVLTRNGRASGLRLPTGDLIESDAVVVACGAATPEVLAECDVRLPALTSRGVLIEASVADPAVLPRLVLRGPDVAVRRRGDDTVLIHAEWADAHVQGTPAMGWDLPRELVGLVLEQARRTLAARPALVLRGVHAGRRPIPGDRYAVVGETAGVPGLHIAFTHSAATLAPALATALTGEIATGQPCAALQCFRPDRFNAGGPVSLSLNP